MIPTTRFQFRNGVAFGEAVGADASAVSTPWVYVWIDYQTKKAVYVGEYGSSGRYTLAQRLRYSIGDLSHPTLNQLSANSSVTGYDVKSDLSVHAFRLPESGIAQEFRKSVEAWLHWLITHKNSKHHHQYCGFSYSVPLVEARPMAEEIYTQLSNQLSWQ